ncbi:cytochrome c peroxidase [Sporothrix schenckii 1099-18]|uniref:Peroxidase n=2 Tax=Sporothrix schenckii TaxID=29908 RepID=U7Q5B7_SPOS1|nr:cytochrome c peroxidase [Sporothrix schenckii 1099-18]ERT01891.1 cytochrome c peroxidase, mitochondrial [Sporothrix schenckii ATCC 58251]KJR80964.1 cytochrome c peroxidase [Sporothrix schenckii 1099-18]
MASAASRQLFRAATRAAAPARRGFTNSSSSVNASARAAFRQGSAGAGRRYYSSETPKPGSSSSLLWVGVGAVGVGAAAYYLTQNGSASAAAPKAAFKPEFKDYQAVYNEIAKLLQEHDEYDDGSYGPVLVRLAWHASGTYDKETGTGGSNGATMRFAPESNHGANAGLINARNFLEPVKAKFPWISYSDLWILGGVCSIQEMLGPKIPFRAGRRDRDVNSCTPDGRLPDAAQGADHVRNIFYRMGFNDQEIVALAGAHALGRCHTQNSGFDGPWTFSPTVLTNDYYKLLLGSKWQWRKWDGPKQYEDKETKSLMMLPADMAFVQDKTFKKTVEKYAADNDLFFKDFAAVIVKLFELGVPFPENTETYVFKNLGE